MGDQQLCYSQKNVRTANPKNIFLQRLYIHLHPNYDTMGDSVYFFLQLSKCKIRN